MGKYGREGWEGGREGVVFDTFASIAIGGV